MHSNHRAEYSELAAERIEKGSSFVVTILKILGLLAGLIAVCIVSVMVSNFETAYRHLREWENRGIDTYQLSFVSHDSAYMGEVGESIRIRVENGQVVESGFSDIDEVGVDLSQYEPYTIDAIFGMAMRCLLCFILYDETYGYPKTMFYLNGRVEVWVAPRIEAN